MRVHVSVPQQGLDLTTWLLIVFMIAVVLTANTAKSSPVVSDSSIQLSHNSEEIANSGHGGGHGHHGTPPEHFLILDLLAEAVHSSVGMLWIKVTELKPKFEYIRQLYENGEKTKALATSLGVATEVVLLGFFVEAFGIAELFIGALSFSDDWIFHMALSLVGVNLSTKAAVAIAEGVEEAVEEKYKHSPQDSTSQKSTPSPQH
ncbi:hypothetical protein TI03_01055 [Achromatium sp. WMS1]|nr:hypothetical protein TI03_01055 [Achromatium sp. WMS1]